MNKKINMHLTKRLVDLGISSRRQAEKLIRGGKIQVNSQLATLGQTVDEADQIKVNNKLFNKPVNRQLALLFNKPIGYTCTHRQFTGEKNIFSLLPRTYHQLKIAGRLDKDSRGLLILSNDGDLILKLSHPRFEQEKTYRVMVTGSGLINEREGKNICQIFIQGVNIGQKDGVVKAKKINYLGNNVFLMVITQGKNRQIKRMFQTIKLSVSDLQRVKLASFSLNNLAEGKYQKLDNKQIEQIKMLKN